MTQVIGYWKSETQDDKWDDYLKAVGVNFALRAFAKRIGSTEEIQQHDDGYWTLDITSTFKNANLKFKLGEEFPEKTMDGRDVKSVFNIEGETLVHYQKSTKVGIPDCVIVRERVDDNTLTLTFEAIGKDVKTVRTFSKQTKPEK